jgi:hypothetical protein
VLFYGPACCFDGIVATAAGAVGDGVCAASSDYRAAVHFFLAVGNTGASGIRRDVVPEQGTIFRPAARPAFCGFVDAAMMSRV